MKKSFLSLVNFTLSDGFYSTAIKNILGVAVLLMFLVFAKYSVWNRLTIPMFDRTEQCIASDPIKSYCPDKNISECKKMFLRAPYANDCVSEPSASTCRCAYSYQAMATIFRNTVAFATPVVFFMFKSWRSQYFGPYMLGLGLLIESVTFLKEHVLELRPDGSNYASFPSAHSALSFYGSGFIFLFCSKLIGAPLLIMSTIVAYSRMYCMKHFFHDLVAGAFMAILFTHAHKACVYILQRIKKDLSTK